MIDQTVCIKCDKEIPDDAQVCPYCHADNSETAPNPCFKCDDRTQVCHDICRKYKTWTRRRNRLLDRRYKIKYEQSTIPRKKRRRRR